MVANRTVELGFGSGIKLAILVWKGKRIILYQKEGYGNTKTKVFAFM
jgi:hypothetical protein